MVATKLDGYRCYFDTVIRLLDKVVSHKLPRRFQSTRKIPDSTSHSLCYVDIAARQKAVVWLWRQLLERRCFVVVWWSINQFRGLLVRPTFFVRCQNI